MRRFERLARRWCMPNRPRLLLLALVLGGCIADGPSGPATPSPISTPDLSPTPDDLALADAIVAWARLRDPAVLEPSAFADEVALGLGQEMLAFRSFADLSEPTAWRLDRDVFRAHVGPFSALDQLGRDGEVTVSVGPHPHCASPPMDPPPGLQGHRRLSIQPASARSCVQWWAVDLFLGADGRVEAITLDLYEP